MVPLVGCLLSKQFCVSGIRLVEHGGFTPFVVNKLQAITSSASGRRKDWSQLCLSLFFFNSPTMPEAKLKIHPSDDTP